MINDSKEYIVASAIHYDDGLEYPYQDIYGIETGFVLCGFRHPMIISILPTIFFYKAEQRNSKLQKNKTTQGFITSYGRFVDRHEAYEIAFDCGQIKSKSPVGTLYSEDVFPNQRYKG